MKVKVKLLGRVRLFVTPWTVARQAPLSMGILQARNWSGLPYPTPGDLPDPGIEPTSPVLQADSLSLSRLGSPKMLPLEKSRSILTEKQPAGAFWVIRGIIFV